MNKYILINRFSTHEVRDIVGMIDTESLSDFEMEFTTDPPALYIYPNTDIGAGIASLIVTFNLTGQLATDDVVARKIIEDEFSRVLRDLEIGSAPTQVFYPPSGSTVISVV